MDAIQPQGKLSDSINDLIDSLTLLEIEEVKNRLWKILAILSIQEDKSLAVELLAEDRHDLIALLGKDKKYSPGVVQDAVLEFWREVQTEIEKAEDGEK